MISKYKFILATTCSLLMFSSCSKKVEDRNEHKNPNQSSKTDDKNTELTNLDIPAIESVFGMKGSENNGEYKITVPQNDLNVMVDDFQIIPPMGLGSWAAFSPTKKGAMIMGDIVVTEKDLWPVQQEVIKQGLSITAIHNHFARMEPDIWYMHIGGMGNGTDLASKVKAVFEKVKEIRGGNPADGQATEVKNTLDTAMVTRILGHSGSMNRGVYKVVIGRPDVKLTDHGAPVSTFMGFNTWASWQGTNEKAAVAGDFAMLENEVEPVIQALIENGIEVVAVHNHMVHEDPRIFYLHYWGVGSAEKLAQGLRQALNETNN